jgi:dTDP-glucose 4,6-dehydratase
MAEMTLRCYHDAYGMDLTVIRSCNLVGGRQRARKLIPTSVQEIAANRPVPVCGTGHQVREYLAVEDLCEALRMAMRGVLPPDTYHCSSTVAFTVLDVIDVVAGALGKQPGLVHVPDRLVQDQAYAMDPSRLRSFGWAAHSIPAEAIARAAEDLHAARVQGADLLRR